MPLRVSSKQSPAAGSSYFVSLEQLDAWAAQSHRPLTGLIPYCPRRPTAAQRGKLLVCHDYKGGYSENPIGLSYSFNFWSLCDTFIYFSHHRVTVPPPGWVNAAHRQGVKILGTLIFEPPSGEEDCLRLLVGRLPKSKTGPASDNALGTVPLSRHYARILAELAFQRGFDGYLLNVEVNLQGSFEQTRALAAWDLLLQEELTRTIGTHAQTIWYDSVVVSGQLAWQDRLNNFNLPFFQSSSSIFTNYTWREAYPALSVAYLRRLAATNKKISDLFIGIDVWGRGTYGGGGLGCFRALSLISPKSPRSDSGHIIASGQDSSTVSDSTGLSVALFGQAWTWESEQDKPGFTWESWWNYERTLWEGPSLQGDTVEVPKPPARKGEPDCPPGVFAPIASFFSRLAPPNPMDLAIYTTFSPGIGRAWFVAGKNVYKQLEGWTDIEKQTSLGDLVWPRPMVVWEDDEGSQLGHSLPTASVHLCFEDAWNGGNSLEITLRSQPAEEPADSSFRCVWFPIQSLSITGTVSYEAVAIYKMGTIDDNVDLDIGLSIKLFSGTTQPAIQVTPKQWDQIYLPGGWVKLAVRFILPVLNVETIAHIGLVVSIITNDASVSSEFSVRVGQLSVYPSTLKIYSVHHPTILWADFTTDTAPANVDNQKISFGSISWDVAAAFHPLTNIHFDPTTPENTKPTWTLDSRPGWFPSFVYFNVYAQILRGAEHVAPENSVWIGTSQGDSTSFEIPSDLGKILAENASTGNQIQSVRYYVQGVTNQGQVLAWDKCVYVDVVA